MNGLLADRVNDLSGQTIQLCYHCHKCTGGCPAAHAMEYGPDRVLRLIQLGQQERLLASRDAWLCLECEMCSAHCPNDIDVAEVMVALREIADEANLVDGYGAADCQGLRELLTEYLAQRPGAVIDDRLCAGVQRLSSLGRTVASAHNISDDDNSERLIWSQNLAHVPAGLDGQQGAELVYFVGCVASFFPRSYRVPQAMVAILGSGAVAFTTLGGQEWCCGYPLLSMGRLDQAKTLIQHNVTQIKDIGASRVVFTCPSCYHMWKFVYPRVLGQGSSLIAGLEVLHATEMLDELITEGVVHLGELPLRVTYHDPCDLGRKSQVYDPPRRVLRSIPGVNLVEMSCAGQISECCGGGGNLESFDAAVVGEVSLRRVEHASEVLALASATSQQPVAGQRRVLVSACQQCERTLMAAARRHNGAPGTRVRVMDVTEMVWSSMERAASD